LPKISPWSRSGLHHGRGRSACAVTMVVIGSASFGVLVHPTNHGGRL
jgi:hypothetical protein